MPRLFLEFLDCVFSARFCFTTVAIRQAQKNRRRTDSCQLGRQQRRKISLPYHELSPYRARRFYYFFCTIPSSFNRIFSFARSATTLDWKREEKTTKGSCGDDDDDGIRLGGARVKNQVKLRDGSSFFSTQRFFLFHESFTPTPLASMWPRAGAPVRGSRSALILIEEEIFDFKAANLIRSCVRGRLKISKAIRKLLSQLKCVPMTDCEYSWRVNWYRHGKSALKAEAIHGSTWFN